MDIEKLPEALCSGCGQVGRVVRFVRPETVTVRGLDFQVDKVLRRCEGCGAEFENTKDPDWRVDAYAQFRAARGMLTPESIVGWRKEYELTQAEVTALLGWGEVTLGRYEKGALQSDAHDQQLSELMNPDNLARALAARPDATPEEKRLAILGKIREGKGLLSPQDMRAVRMKYGLTEAEMDRLLSLDDGNWGAWERGESIHSKAMDTLVREMAEQPDIVRHLLGKSGVESPAAKVVLRRIDDDVESRVAKAIRRQFGSSIGVDVEELVRLATEEIRRAQLDAANRIGRAA